MCPPSPPSLRALPPTFPHPNAFKTLVPHLLPLLPSSLPLLRRLQFHTSSPHASALATFSPGAAPTSSFAACWYDRVRAPETECWLFSTFEVPPSTNSSTTTATRITGTQDASIARAQLLALLLAVADAENEMNGEGGSESGSGMGSGRKNGMVIGSVHTSLLPLLAGGEDALPDTGGVVSREVEGCVGGEGSVLGAVSGVYVKWLIPPESSPSPPLPSSSPGEVALPQNYTFSTLQAQELPRVVASTHIPRTEKTLAELGNICVRDTQGRLVSWGFLGVDGSLSSLYTEEGARGKGLGKAVARALVRGLEKGGDGGKDEEVREEKREEGGGVEELRMGFRGVGNGEGWVHSDIDPENKESAAVARAVGGRVGWECRWISVDLGRVRDVVLKM